MLRFDAVPQSVALLLRQLTDHPALADFSLGGGTSLTLRFGHRLSIDLDYFTETEFSTDTLFEHLGLEKSSIVSVASNSMSLDANGVKIDLLRHRYPEIFPSEKTDGVRLLSLPDLAAMKLNAIANRGSKKDFYDLAELLKHFTLPDMLKFFVSKYPTIDTFAVIRSLAWFTDADTEPDPLPLIGQSWDGIKSNIQRAVSDL